MENRSEYYVCISLVRIPNHHKVNNARNYSSVLACCALLGGSYATLTVRITDRTCQYIYKKLLTKCDRLAMENAHRMKAYISRPMSTVAPFLPFTLYIPLDLSHDLHYVYNYASSTIYPMHFNGTILRPSFLSDGGVMSRGD